MATEGKSHWEAIALPLLVCLNEKQDELRQRGLLEVGPGNRGGETLGLDLDEGALFEALFQLQDVGYLDFKVEYESGGALFLDLHVTGRGLQVLGHWPRFEAWISPETLATFAEDLAEFAPGDDRSRLRRAADYFRRQSPRALKGAAIALGSQMVRSGLGLP